MVRSILGTSVGLFLLTMVSVSNATLLNECAGTVCDGSYNIVISDNNSDIDAMFTIENSILTTWMWTDAIAAQSFGVNTLPTIRGLDESILLGRGLGLDFENPDWQDGELWRLALFVDAATGDNMMGTFLQYPIPISAPDQCPIAGRFSCTYQVTAKVAEPTTFALMGLGLAVVGFPRRKITK